MKDYLVKESFPTIITPKNLNISFNELLNSLPTYHTELKELLLKNGALIFRGFPIHVGDDFYQLIKALNLGKLMDYVGGDSPRDKVKDKVYTSTEAPPSLHLPLHQELSYVKSFPKHIYFFCEIAPQHRGETIIADARKVYRALDTEVKRSFEDHGVTYISHYYQHSLKMRLLKRFVRAHKSWMEVFETDNKQKVEKLCHLNDISYQWQKNDWIETRQTMPAILNHPITNETVWFNQAHLFDFNPKLLGWMRFIGAQLFYFNPKTRLHDVTFANGKRIPRKHFYHILNVLEATTVAEPWQQGDVMILDNVLTMHGRAPFKGKRRILTAMTD